ncbi:MAG: hydroxymethylbilane synthase [Candidatus Bathyarchaeota archaeon]|nr:hydroxymethylbilane synthase [Candidatus Bathyarchaeota archaeon]
MILRVGTRGSKLSIMQTEALLREIQSAYSNVEFKVRIIKTLGDWERKKPLFTIDSKGIFEKEIDQAILRGEIDLAVHSLKDIPILELPDTVIAAIPKRGSRRDALISKDKIPLKELPRGATVGTGSLRRLAQVKFLRPDLEVKPIRGNIDTRIRKVKKGEFDAIIVAEVALERMELRDEITERFPLEQFSPSAGQGALAIVTAKNNDEVIELVRVVDDAQTRAEVTAERSLVMHLEGGCRVPIGAVGCAEGDRLSLQACMFSLNSRRKISSSAEGTLSEAREIGKQAAQNLLKQGAKELENEWREKYGAW